MEDDEVLFGAVDSGQKSSLGSKTASLRSGTDFGLEMCNPSTEEQYCSLRDSGRYEALVGKEIQNFYPGGAGYNVTRFYPTGYDSFFGGISFFRALKEPSKRSGARL